MERQVAGTLLFLVFAWIDGGLYLILSGPTVVIVPLGLLVVLVGFVHVLFQLTVVHFVLYQHTVPPLP